MSSSNTGTLITLIAVGSVGMCFFIKSRGDFEEAISPFDFPEPEEVVVLPIVANQFKPPDPYAFTAAEMLSWLQRKEPPKEIVWNETQTSLAAAKKGRVVRIG